MNIQSFKVMKLQKNCSHISILHFTLSSDALHKIEKQLAGHILNTTWK